MLLKRTKKFYERQKELQKEIVEYGQDILEAKAFRESKKNMQHGTVSVQEHSMYVTRASLFIAEELKIRVNKRDLVRGALLHDYFQYDWHIGHPDLEGKLHGFKHPEIALKNAEKEFQLTEKQRDIISHHMFPLTLRPPKCKEAWVVTMVDKYCSLLETFHMVKGIKSRLHKK